jgi:flagellar L-ring protein precursor FlgH
MLSYSVRALTSASMAVVVLAGALAAQSAGAAAKTAPPAPDSLAAAPSHRQSWTSDKQRLGIGDIVTILIDERTLASANLTDNNSETKKKGLGLDVEPPGSPGKPSVGIKATADFNNDGASRKQGEATRRNSFQSEMSARVIAVSPGGMLRIRGHKLVNVDKNVQDVTVTGWIRPQDIAIATNTIASARIADAEVNYTQQGALGKPRSGLLSKLFGAIWP